MSIGLKAQEKKRKIYFQDSSYGGHLGFPIGTILAILFYLQVTPMLPTKFQVNWPFHSGEEAKNKFSGWRPCWISDRNDFSYLFFFFCFFFGSTGHPMLPTKFQVHWPFVSGEEAKNKFSRWWPWRPSWISNRNNFSYLFIYMSP